jgi:hypothetical protein
VVKMMFDSERPLLLSTMRILARLWDRVTMAWKAQALGSTLNLPRPVTDTMLCLSFCFSRMGPLWSLWIRDTTGNSCFKIFKVWG